MIEIATWALIAYVGFGVFLFFAQRGMLYFPTPRIDHGYAEEVFESNGEEIVVVVINPGEPRGALYFGGNGDAVALYGGELSTIDGVTFYLVNYRGYGGSSGSPSETGIFADAGLIFDAVSTRHDDMAVIGRSLGSGVATWLAAERDIGRMVLVTPFDSVLAVAAGRFPFYPASLILKDHYDSVGRADEIDVPTLVLVAESDNVIPRKHTDRMIDALGENVTEAIVLGGTGHNTIIGHPLYLPQLEAFLQGP